MKLTMIRYLTTLIALCLSVVSFASETPCLDPLACNFMEEGECFFTNENGEPCVTEGCTIQGACNYDPEADIYDGSCEFESCLGCTDAEACNYDETALYDDATCIYYVDCNGTCGGDWIEDACGNCYEANVFSESSILIQTCSVSGIQGPSSEDCDYGESNPLIEVIGGIQFFTVPETRVYRLEAVGAAGGGTMPGWGAKVSGDFYLQQGEVLKMLVGQVGSEETFSREYNAGGGGGGTFISKEINEECLIVAGGGGGCGADGPGSGAIFNEFDDNTGELGLGGECWDGNAGAGFWGGGCYGFGHPGGSSAGSFVSGGWGGYGSAEGGQGSGGFGGGGGEGYADGGGGGGYSGGNGANGDGIGGFGGSSFNSGDNPTEDGYNSGPGFIVITWESELITPPCNPGCTYPQACNYDPESNFDDGSCDYCFCLEGTQWNDSLQGCVSTAPPLMDACGEGTYWDDEAQACLTTVTCAEDLNTDGIVGIADLLQLLSMFGTPCDEVETSELSCGDPMNYHGYDYATVQIGDQCWFAENLRTELYSNGDSIPGGLSDGEWSDTTAGVQGVYANDAANLMDYGRLYNWYAVDDSRGLCPSGWHVPSDGQYTALTDFIAGEESAVGDVMKSSPSDSPPWDGINTSGFSGLAGGVLSHLNQEVQPTSNGLGVYGYYWSSSQHSNLVNAWARQLNTGASDIFRVGSFRLYGLSVRCIKDTE